MSSHSTRFRASVPLSSRVNLPISSLIKVPRQARAISTVSAILDAAVVVLNQGDPARFTTNHVAEVAGVSVGTLYQYFSNKDALLAGVLERGVLDVEDTLRGVEVPRDQPLDEVLSATLTLILVGLEPYGTLLRVILSTSPLLSRTGILPLLEPRLTGALYDVLLARPDLVLEGGRAAVFVAVNSTVVVALRWLAERPPGVGREELVAALTRQCMAHVVRRGS